jgi:TIR domain/AAA ATPase domain
MVEMDAPKPVVFVSYGRYDAAEFVNRLVAELPRHGFDVWRDTARIQAGSCWGDVLKDAIDACDAVVAVLTPHAVRRQADRSGTDGVCLDELSYARLGPSSKPIVPVKILDCEIPFSIFRLSYVDMMEWRQSSGEFERGLGKIIQGLKAALRGVPPELRTHEGPIALDQGPYLYEKRDGFVGREWLFNRVSAWLRTARSESALLITGEPGIGKSAFIAELAHRNLDGRVVAYHFCTREDRLTLEPGAFVSSLAAILASRLPSFAPMLNDEKVRTALREARAYPGQALDQAIIAPLSRLPAPAGGARVILVDALDEAMSVAPGSEATDDGNIVSLLASRLHRLPAWLRVIATARRDRRTSQELAGLRATVVDAQADENVHDLTEFVDAQVRTGLQVADPATVAHEIVRLADGNFLYAKSVMRGLKHDQIPVDSLDSFPPGMSGFYGRQFRRLLSATSDAAARPVLEVLVAAQAPLDLTVITSAAAIDRHETVAALNMLSEFVKDRDGGLVLFHRSLADWLIDPQSSFFVDPHRGHERLAAEYAAALDAGPQPQEPPAGTAAVAYRGQYGLDHLAQAGVAVSLSWNPWIFAATALSAPEAKTGHGFGAETQFVPIFAQQYVAAALSASDLTKVTDLVVLLAQAARVRYHDAGVLRIDVAADGTWTKQIGGQAHDGRSLEEALTLSAWAGGITNAAVTAYPDRTQELGPAIETLGGLSYLAQGLDLWAGQFDYEALHGNVLGHELKALARTNQP